jgi:hypothetical protein
MTAPDPNSGRRSDIAACRRSGRIGQPYSLLGPCSRITRDSEAPVCRQDDDQVAEAHPPIADGDKKPPQTAISNKHRTDIALNLNQGRHQLEA